MDPYLETYYRENSIKYKIYTYIHGETFFLYVNHIDKNH